jgi:RNA polymerase sigma-70 factor (ECF subfamily)
MGRSPAPGAESARGRRRTAADEALVRTLFEEHGRALLAYVTRLTGGDRAAAEDIVQETLVRAWRHLESLDERRGPVRGWLFTVARNLVVDRSRARAARPTEVAESPARPPVTGDPTEGIGDSMAVLGALDRLPEDRRDVLVHLYLHGRSVAETADALSIPPGTVKSRSFYALRELRVALSEEAREKAVAS